MPDLASGVRPQPLRPQISMITKRNLPMRTIFLRDHETRRGLHRPGMLAGTPHCHDREDL
jgi:hypothetical protein